MTIKIYLGVIGSGKSYRSQQLVDQGYKKVSVADALRETLWSILGWKPQTDWEYQEFKKATMVCPNGKSFANGMTFFPISGRTMLQNIGETFKDIFGRDYWSELWYYNIRQSTTKDVVCDDIRFPEEVGEALQLLEDGYNVEFIFCNYNSDRYTPNNTHISERYAHMLLALNKYKDGDVVDIEDLKTINEKFYDFK
jgi:hypothetical protein